MIRADAEMSVSRFAELIEVPRRTYHYRLAKHRAGDPEKGPWPAPVVDRIEPAVAKLAGDWPAWGHRKIWAMGAFEGHDLGSASSVRRAMARRGLLQPVDYQTERRDLAKARRDTFVAPVTSRNRVWQADFSEIETSAEGVWRFCPVVDYRAKLVLSSPLSPTATGTDLARAFDLAVAAAEELLGGPLLDDLVDPVTGEIIPLKIVTDNGPAMKSNAVARWFADRPWVTHVRTRVRSPETNGVVERTIGSIKYERLYRETLDTGLDVADHLAGYQHEFNTIRPHEALGWARPLDYYLQNPQTEDPEI